MVSRPLQGLIRFLVHLAEQLYRAAAGQPDVERANTRSKFNPIVAACTDVIYTRIL